MRLNIALPIRLTLDWQHRDGWLGAHLPQSEFISTAFNQELAIEHLAARTERLGEFPLHEVYGQAGAVRHPDAVRSPVAYGRLYRWLVVHRRPEVVVEFGSAFGISGMYWLAGLEENGSGELLTFEINEEWQRIAAGNLSAIGSRFNSTAGAFEDKVDAALENRKIDLAFIDAVHTSAWVLPQFERVMQRIKPGGLVVFDDIDFSDDMRDAWKTVASDPRGAAAVAVQGRVGLFEVSLIPLCARPCARTQRSPICA
jgi:predicted O-methyltransferase YrrM